MAEEVEAKSRHDGIAVFWSRRGSTGDECGRELDRGSFLRLVDGKAYCMACADLEHLWFLPRGDAALTRRARRNSGLSAVVLQWSRSRRRYERQGILVESAALARAEKSASPTPTFEKLAVSVPPKNVPAGTSSS